MASYPKPSSFAMRPRKYHQYLEQHDELPSDAVCHTADDSRELLAMEHAVVLIRPARRAHTLQGVLEKAARHIDARERHREDVRRKRCFFPEDTKLSALNLSLGSPYVQCSGRNRLSERRCFERIKPGVDFGTCLASRQTRSFPAHRRSQYTLEMDAFLRLSCARCKAPLANAWVPPHAELLWRSHSSFPRKKH